jgi:GNAT superfamily N-acetyltransferase
LSNLYKAAPLDKKKHGDLHKVFSNSMYKCFLFEKDIHIDDGRAFADGINCSCICEVVVLPTHQGKGVGKSIVSNLVELSGEHKKIILYSYPRKEGFYKKRLAFSV